MLTAGLAHPAELGSVFMPGPAVMSLLDVDPDLGSGVPPEHQRAVRLALRAEIVRVNKGQSIPPVDADSGLGLLLLSGLLARIVRVGRRESLELLGPGDLIRPGNEEQTSLVECHVRWQPLEDLTLARLDERFCRAIGPWPRLTAALATRAIRRAKWLSVQAAIDAHPTVEERLMLLLSHLGDRMGRMTREGVVLDLPLSHRLLAHSVRALRPSVTAGLLRLRDNEYLRQPQRHSWLITQAGLGFAEELCGQHVIDC